MATREARKSKDPLARLLALNIYRFRRAQLMTHEQVVTAMMALGHKRMTRFTLTAIEGYTRRLTAIELQMLSLIFKQPMHAFFERMRRSEVTT